MKLLRYGPVGNEKPAILDQNGDIRDISGLITDFTTEQLLPENLKKLTKVDVTSLPVVTGNPRLGAPFVGSRKFLAIGLNYADHAAEANMPIPPEPILFTKTTSCIQGPDDDVMIPKNSKKTDWEVELGIVIGKCASYVDKSDALEHVAGYVLINDVSEREFQLERGGSWDKGKGCDTFGPIGPWLVTSDEIGDPHDLDMWLDVNGTRMQTGNTRTMIFDIPTIVSYVSQFMTLEPGDIITTGTPPGVGMGFKPDPIFLKPGDQIHLGIEKLGEQRQAVVEWQERSD
ncbi:fumarylacetoacetate hydrolase family protein [Hyphococcus lacteus]|uniref:Fumarylacetoacetate hydrolase family protein n=1 Tax=Hyphococcus lacteus TaxID=3143536 RepID=A0ABV3Z7E1_9PROT